MIRIPHWICDAGDAEKDCGDDSPYCQAPVRLRCFSFQLNHSPVANRQLILQQGNVRLRIALTNLFDLIAKGLFSTFKLLRRVYGRHLSGEAVDFQPVLLRGSRDFAILASPLIRLSFCLLPTFLSQWEDPPGNVDLIYKSLRVPRKRSVAERDLIDLSDSLERLLLNNKAIHGPQQSGVSIRREIWFFAQPVWMFAK
jgi:hypothetical protein